MQSRFIHALVTMGTGALLACAVAGRQLEDDIDPVDGGSAREGGAPCTSMCGGECADLKTDSANCGKCGNACPMDAKCVQGSCQCTTGALCDGACVDLKTDVAHCGKCGNACAAGDAGALAGGGAWACKAGACEVTCPMPKSACAPLGCFDLQSDDKNCGMCANDCGGNLCLQGGCCQSGEVNCNNQCTNTASDPNNCGQCGTKCQNGSCTMGKCCSKPPNGNCSHNPCTQGTKLTNNCDGVGCVAKVCQNDPYCCSTNWDSYCVQEVDMYCGPQYKCSC